MIGLYLAFRFGRAVLSEIHPLAGYLDYAFDWAEGNDWSLIGGPTTRNADRQCCGQTYTALYNLSPQPEYSWCSFLCGRPYPLL